VYDDPDAVGKTEGHTDTYHGRFVELVPDTRVVEETEFETDDPALLGTIVMTTTLSDADGGTDVLIEYDGLPDAVAPADNELGTRMALEKLARLLES
jgi:uncharacterized protein YndB with AHSA1/START domain